MNTADLITAFLSNEMNPAQEREFLLSVAASDTQRLALKSHVMLDRVLARQVQRASVPDSVRGTIFSAAAASLAEPLPAPQAASKTLAAQGGLAARLRAFASRTAMPMVATMLTLGGFTAGYYTSSEVATNPESNNASVVTPAATATPRVADPAPAVVAPVQSSAQQDVAATVQEEIPAAQAVTSRTAARKSSATRPSRSAATPSTSDASAVQPSQSGSATTTDTGNEPSRSSVDQNDPSMQVNLTIRKPSDTSSQKQESNQGTP